MKKTNNDSKRIFSIRHSLFLILFYSYLIVLILWLPFAIAHALGYNWFEDLGFKDKNAYIFTTIADIIGLIFTFTLVKRHLERIGRKWYDIGFKRVSFKKSILYILGYYGILIGVLFLGAAIIMALGIDLGSGNNTPPQSADLLKASGGFWPALLGGVIIAPFMEEVLFRGILFPALRNKYGKILGIIFTTAIFALIHINPVQILGAIPISIYLCIIYSRTGSIFPGMILHATSNMMVLLIASSYIR